MYRIAVSSEKLIEFGSNVKSFEAVIISECDILDDALASLRSSVDEETADAISKITAGIRNEILESKADLHMLSERIFAYATAVRNIERSIEMEISSRGITAEKNANSVSKDVVRGSIDATYNAPTVFSDQRAAEPNRCIETSVNQLAKRTNSIRKTICAWICGRIIKDNVDAMDSEYLTKTAYKISRVKAVYTVVSTVKDLIGAIAGTSASQPSAIDESYVDESIDNAIKFVDGQLSLDSDLGPEKRINRDPTVIPQEQIDSHVLIVDNSDNPCGID